MKVLILGDINSSHVIKWATGLHEKGIDVVVFSLSAVRDDTSSTYNNITHYCMGVKGGAFNSPDTSKWQYLKHVSKLKQIIKDHNPNIVHAHYATSYGTLATVSGFHPRIISVWGSDVFDFPKKSIIHRKLLEYNLNRADRILSTSKVMAVETKKYAQKDVMVTPFGIDMQRFKPNSVQRSSDEIVVGTVKAMEDKYGIHILIDAFNLLCAKHKQKKLKLLLVGGGTQLERYKNRAQELGLGSKVEFTGRVNFSDIPSYHNMIDIYVAVSTLDSESFGVAIIEASSCAKPVVVSDVGGLPEVVDNNITGYVVPRNNVRATFEAINSLVVDSQIRERMGIEGRKRVAEFYNWEDNLNLMIEIYQRTIN